MPWLDEIDRSPNTRALKLERVVAILYDALQRTVDFHARVRYWVQRPLGLGWVKYPGLRTFPSGLPVPTDDAKVNVGGRSIDLIPAYLSGLTIEFARGPVPWRPEETWFSTLAFDLRRALFPQLKERRTGYFIPAKRSRSPASARLNLRVPHR